MQYKYEHTSVPAYSQFVQLQETMIFHVQQTWHAVHVGKMSTHELEDLYAWCDQHIHHAWCVLNHRLYFLEESDAVQVALIHEANKS
jgi:hypothetical protein